MRICWTSLRAPRSPRRTGCPRASGARSSRSWPRRTGGPGGCSDMTWVLLRGLTREARHWGDFAERLARALPGSASAATRVLALDLPGNGVFCGEASPATVGAMADFAREQLRARGLAPPYRLVAMSLGGMVAADWALRHPREIERLVLV